jgi:hypothetical protein
MKSLVLLTFLLSIQAVHPFVAPPAFGQKTMTTTTSSTQINYKDRRDEIAKELMEIVPGEHKAKYSPDHSLWKRIMELEKAGDQAYELRKKLESIKNQQERGYYMKENETVQRLEKLVLSLFHITRELNVEDVQLLEQVARLEEERNSLRKLIRRTFALLGERINNTVGKNVDRLLKLVHLYHE